MTVEILNVDCMEYMATLEDNAFDLAIVDPPYGGGNRSINNLRTGGAWAAKYGKKINEWDIPPGPEYFLELYRISKNQIIWGANYFNMPPARCFIILRKPFISESFTMAMGEYAWTSFDANAKIWNWSRKLEDTRDRTHPTQKPVSLYRWLLANYAKPGQRILDTHLGSGSSAIAAHYFGCDFVGCELDNEYYKAAVDRFDKETRQQILL